MLYTTKPAYIFERLETQDFSGIVVNIVSTKHNNFTVPAYKVLSDNDNELIDVLYLPLGE